MSTSKRITLLILILAVSLISILVTVFSRSTNASQKPLRGKILRAKDKFDIKPNGREIKALQEGAPTDNERRLENQIPKHVPLKVKIKNDKLEKFKDLKNEKWASDLELEVTNTGTKPIYSLYLLLVLPEIKAQGNGYNVVFPLYYGPDTVGEIWTKASPQDIPIAPGETYVMKVHPGNAAGYELANRKFGRTQPRRLILQLETLSFGDGTGYWGGEEVPKKSGSVSSMGVRDPNKSDRASPESLAAAKRTRTSYSDFYSPATFLMASFFFPTLIGAVTSQDTQTCCSGDDCYPMIVKRYRECYNCAPQQRITATSCSDSLGKCYSATFGSVDCLLDDGEIFLCVTVDTSPCGQSAPTPTPTPTPSATRTPNPLTDPSNCASGIARDYTTNPDPPGGPDGGGCPINYQPDGLCCVRLPCPSPTPTPPQCERGYPVFFNYPECSWICFDPSPPPPPPNSGPDGIFTYYCTPYYWVTYVSYDDGKTWYPTGETEYVGCF